MDNLNFIPACILEHKVLVLGHLLRWAFCVHNSTEVRCLNLNHLEWDTNVMPLASHLSASKDFRIGEDAERNDG